METNLNQKNPTEMVVVQLTLRNYVVQEFFNELSLRTINIDYLTKLYEIHGILPQAAMFFEKYFPQHMVFQHLRTRRMIVGCNNLRIDSFTQDVTEALRTEGVSLLVLKGTVIANKLYNSIADRAISDADILVSIRDRGAADLALRKIGFKPIVDLLSDDARFFYDREAPLEYRSGEGDVVDLHYAGRSTFVYSPGSYVELLEKYGGANRDGPGFFPLSDYDLFSFLCEHGTKHMWCRLVWLLDVALLLRKSTSLSLALLKEGFSKSGNEESLQLVLSLLRAYSLLPEKYLEDDFVLTKNLKSILRRHSVVTNQSEILPRDLYLHLSVLKNWRKRLHYLLGRAFLVKRQDISIIRLPKWLAWSYPLIRVFRLLISRLDRFFHPLYRAAKKAILKYGLLVETLLVGAYSRIMVRYFGKAILKQESALSEKEDPSQGVTIPLVAQGKKIDTVIYLVESIKSGRKLIGRGTCFTEAFMLQLMLARRRIPSRIQFGAKRGENEKFLAHAWLEIDGVPVFGFEEEKQYLRFQSSVIGLVSSKSLWHTHIPITIFALIVIFHS